MLPSMNELTKTHFLNNQTMTLAVNTTVHGYRNTVIKE